MADTMKDKLEETGHTIKEEATKLGHRISEKAEEAADWAKEKVHQTGSHGQGVGETIKEEATKLGHKIGEKTEEAANWAKEKAHQAGHRVEELTDKLHQRTATPLAESTGTIGSMSDIREHMDVYASCGKKVGKVDHVEGGTIKLTKNDSPDGMHHTIPLSWVAKVHDHIHLNRDHKAVESGWGDA